jgi:hypothetical protein
MGFQNLIANFMAFAGYFSLIAIALFILSIFLIADFLRWTFKINKIESLLQRIEESTRHRSNAPESPATLSNNEPQTISDEIDEKFPRSVKFAICAVILIGVIAFFAQ